MLQLLGDDPLPETFVRRPTGEWRITIPKSRIRPSALSYSLWTTGG